MVENSKFSAGLGDVRNLLGFLVAGFAGVLNVLGLKSAEIGVVLRNLPLQVGIVAVFLLVAVLTAVISVFVDADKHPVSAPVAAIVLLLTAATFPLLVWAIPAPFPGHSNEHTTSIWVTWSLLGAALLIAAGDLVVRNLRQRWIPRSLVPAVSLAYAVVPAPAAPAAVAAETEPTAETAPTAGVAPMAGPVPAVAATSASPAAYAVAVAPQAAPATPPGPSRRFPDVLNLQCLLLAAAVILTSTAAYGAMRVETISQTSTIAEIGDTLQMNGRNDTLAIAVSASKLTTVDWLGVNVLAVPRHWKLTKFCHRAAVTRLRATFSIQCTQDPCLYAAKVRGHAHCTELSEDVIAPDSTGSVQRTLDVSFAAPKFQHVQVTAQACSPRVKGPKGRCLPTGAVSRLDIAVPK